MLNTVWAVVHDGKIQTIKEIDAPEGTWAIITFLDEKRRRRFLASGK